MVMNTHISFMLNGTIESVKTVIPFSIGVDKPSVIKKPLIRTPLGVLIEVTGSIKGRIIIEGNQHIFSKIGEAMFGMSLEGEMLDSFTGELGNMIAGHLATSIANKGVEMDITPPMLLVDYTHDEKYLRALSIPIHFTSVGSFTIILMIHP